MLSVAVSSGEVAVGDEVTLVRGQYPPLSHAHAERVRRLLGLLLRGLMLRGAVTSYSQLHALAGAPTNYSSRGFPRRLKRALADGCPAVHCVLDSQWRLPRNGQGRLHLPDQPRRLAEEGVALDGATGELAGAPEHVAWAPTHEELFAGGGEAPSPRQ